MKTRIKLAFVTALTLASAPALYIGCDSGSSSTDGPATFCTYSFATPTTPGTKKMGEECAADGDCETGVCVKVGDAGNTQNTQFAFCSRGCDCENDTTSRLTTEEKKSYICLYPSGDQGSNHHVVPFCASLSDCTALSAKWTACSSVQATKACSAL